MTLHVGPLPAGDERHLKALEAGAAEVWPGHDAMFLNEVAELIAAYFKALGVHLVDASEVAEWLREDGIATSTLRVADERQRRFLARFGGGDETSTHCPRDEACVIAHECRYCGADRDEPCCPVGGGDGR